MTTPSDRVKLLKFVSLWGVGGTERQVVNLGMTLDPSGFDVRFACLRRWGEFLNEIEARRIPLAEYQIRSFYHYNALIAQRRFLRDLKRNRIQIVHAYNFYANVFAVPVAKLAGVPVVIASIRDMGVYLTPRQKWVQKLVCRWADAILVNAEAVKQWLVLEGYQPEKITVIRNGIDLSKFAGKNGHGNGHLRRELGLDSRAPLVVMLSRLHRLKGIEDFLRAAAIVAGRFREARFLIVGSGFTTRDGGIVEDTAYRNELERCAASLGLERRVVFTGMRHDVPALLSETAVSVLPSLSEGLPNALLESMAMGVPVIATKVGGNPEIVEDGLTGLLVPPRDPEAVGRAICLLLENRRMAAAFGRAGSRRVAEQFSLHRMVSETERFYRRLLEQAGRRTSRGRGRGLAGAYQ
jgi:glycosyltransferase involved in cell wall biosynthesis